MTRKSQRRGTRRHIPRPDIFLLLLMGYEKSWQQQRAMSRSAGCGDGI